MSNQHKSFNKRVAENYNFTKYLAFKMSQRFFAEKNSFSESEIISESLLALCIAAKSFKDRDEDKFRSYLTSVVANRIKRYCLESSAPVTLRYSTHCYYKSMSLVGEGGRSATARRIEATAEQNAYCEQNIEQNNLIDDYYRKEVDPEDYLERVFETKKLHKAISNISSESQRIIKAVYYEDAPVDDLAREMNYSRITIYNKKKAAHKELRELLVA